jgi:hypothetical protein
MLKILPFSTMTLWCSQSFASDYDWKMELGLYSQYLDNQELKSDGGMTYAAQQAALSIEGHRFSEIRKSNLVINTIRTRNNDADAPESNRDFIDIEHKELGEQNLIQLHGNYENTTTFAQALISGNRAAVNVDQTNWNLDEAWQYRWTEKLVVSLGAAQMRTTYDQENTFQSSDYKDQQVNSNAFYNFSESQSWGINVYEDKLVRDADNFVNKTHGIAISNHYNYSETFVAKMRVGYRLTQSLLNTQFVSIDERNSGRSVNIDIKKTFERSQLGLSFIDDLTPKFNGVLDQTQTTEVSFGYRLSEYLALSSKLNFIQRTPLNDYYAEDKVHYSSAIAALGWTPYQQLTVEASYRHVNQVLPEKNIDVDSDVVTLGVRWKIHP